MKVELKMKATELDNMLEWGEVSDNLVAEIEKVLEAMKVKDGPQEATLTISINNDLDLEAEEESEDEESDDTTTETPKE